MKRRWLLYLIGGILFCCALVFFTIVLPIARSIEVITTVSVHKTCIVGQETTEYQFATDQDLTDFICNSADLQQATVIQQDGKSFSFFMEYDGNFVSWSVPNGYSCLSSWTGASIASSGTDPLPDHPDKVEALCHDNAGHILIMKGFLPVPALPSQSG